MTGPIWIRIAGVLGFTAVGFGAFGAHGLEGSLSASDLETYQTGVLYHLVHAVALLATAVLAWHGGAGRGVQVAAWCFLVGTLLFSGSIYLLATDALMGTTLGWLGPVTPIGGVVLLAGWLALLVAAPRAIERHQHHDHTPVP